MDRLGRGRARTELGSKMSPIREDEILIACSRLHLEDVHRNRVSLACGRGEVDWELVCSAAVAHKVAPLVYKNLQSCGPVNDVVPRKIVDQFQNITRWNALKNAIATKQIAEMATYFDSRSYDLLLLKHVALSVRLPHMYDVITSDDIDVAVRPNGEFPDRFDERYLWRIRQWMVADRFRKVSRCFIHDNRDPTDVVLNEFRALGGPSRCVGVELENRIHHDVVWAGVIPIDFREIWRDANRAQVDGRPVYVPDLHDLIIMSAVNVHRKPYPRLRNIAEIHELVRFGRDLDWDVLVRKAQAYQCNILVYSALHATRAVLECDLPESVLTALRPGAVRRRAIALINRRVSPSAIRRPRKPGGRPQGARRGLRDLARRFVALNGRQLIRFVWFRIILHRITGVVKW